MVHEAQKKLALNSSNGTGRYQIRWMEGRAGWEMVLLLLAKSWSWRCHPWNDLHAVRTRSLSCLAFASEIEFDKFWNTKKHFQRDLKWDLMLTKASGQFSVENLFLHTKGLWNGRDSNRMLSNLSRFGKLTAAVRMKAPCMDQSWQSGWVEQQDVTEVLVRYQREPSMAMC